MKLLRFFTLLGAFALILAVLNSCSPSWSSTFQLGSISKKEFTETINMELVKGVIIIPVEINGKTYRFLFDTGAINNISQELQEELGFKELTTGTIKDSDNNIIKVKYVNIDTLMIGGIAFYNQSSFVSDLKANPILRCMNLDGIIGSNVMRFCNWTIDYEKLEIILTNQEFEESAQEIFSIPFETDKQYNQFIKLKIGDKTINRVKVDYGSNGSLSIPNKAYKKLKDYKLITETTFENGFSQSGIVGKILVMRDEITIVDSLYFDNLKFRNVLLKSGGNGLLGSKVFSNWIVTIDWRQHLIHFQAQENQQSELNTFGFRIGYSEKSGIYTQTIVEGGPAEVIGLKPKMKILKFGDIRLKDESDFCKYIYHDTKEEAIDVEFVDFEGDTIKERLVKKKYALK